MCGGKELRCQQRKQENPQLTGSNAVKIRISHSFHVHTGTRADLSIGETATCVFGLQKVILVSLCCRVSQLLATDDEKDAVLGGTLPCSEFCVIKETNDLTGNGITDTAD